MSELRERMVDLYDGAISGRYPLDTVEHGHKIAHRHIMDRYADEKEARRIGNEKMVKKLNETKRKLDKL